ncbi:transglutaminase-like domain-containing protein [Candidatus Woesearchaeota archaeon]|jgi:transglutaminase-like putative cysteine protease|nr:transglutaminase-like domain-containing protein [Candidatus Woesearchaeota archaeon]
MSQEDNLVNKIKEYLRISDNYNLGLKDISQNYQISIIDKTLELPYIIDADMLFTIKSYVKRNTKEDNKYNKAKAIYDWIYNNILYGTSKRTNGYRTSKEVNDLKEGVCGEMAFLYVTFARSIGLISNYVSVTIDKNNEKVCHACANVEVEQGIILVDSAYGSFNINHKEYRIKTDQEMFNTLKSWRNK